MSSETFFSRWSRRKQEVRTAEPPPEDIPAQLETEPSEAPPASAAPQVGEGPAVREAELSAEEIERLPSLEDLTAESDISMFLRKGVPEPMRNAALRRMWSLDPKIRDFVCEAREYAYDWNTPGGVPGSGPLPTTEDVLRMAARIVGGGTSNFGLSDLDATRDSANIASQHREQPSSSDLGTEDSNPVAPHQNPSLMPSEELERGAADQAKAPPLTSSAEVPNTREPAATTEAGRTDEPLSVAPPRRHGSAMPV